MSARSSLLRLLFSLIGLLVLLGLLLPPAPAGAQSSGADYAIPGGHFYTQANGQGGAGGSGFAITDDSAARFWSEFRRLGGVNALGYPISDRFMWDGFQVQATQRVVMQWRPEAGQVYFVNVYDRMHELGKDDWLRAFRQTPGIADWSGDSGLPWERVVARHLALLDGYPKIRARYNAVAGDPVQMNGLPMAPVTDMGAFLMLRAQRVTIQQWKVEAPASGAHAGDVVVTLGGDEGKMAGIYPDAAAFSPKAPGGQIARTPLPPLSVPHQGLGYSMNANFLFNGGTDADMRQLRDAGFSAFLQLFPWKLLEPQPGRYDWSQADAIVGAAERHGLNVIARIDQQPAWAAANPPGVQSGPPADMAALGRFLTAMAQRYQGRIAAYQVWNEPNLWYEWGGKGKMSAAGYVGMLKVAYPAIKGADPRAVVIAGDLTPTGVNDGQTAVDDLTYLRQMYAAGARPYFDVLGAHAAGYNHAPEAALGSDPAHPHHSFYFRRIEELRAVMEQQGDAGKQMWLTEFGWTTDTVNPDYRWYAVDERTQADYLVRAYQMGRQYPWMGVMSLWNFNFAWMAAPGDEKAYWSVMNPDHSPRPAYLALARMAK